MRVKAETTVAAPKEVVARVYLDYGRWPEIFPTIAAARLLHREHGTQVIEVDHRVEGKVVNALTARSADEVELKEWKRAYDATFLNRFEAVPGGTRFTVRGDIRLKGPRRLLSPLVRGHARRLIERLQLQPVKAAAEGRQPGHLGRQRGI
jgi:Polyketide cyclase / dehydrase and lipid transport